MKICLLKIRTIFCSVTLLEEFEYHSIQVEYVTLPGWDCDTSGVRTFDELPENARKYVQEIEKQIGVRGADLKSFFF